jgi:hypothetical protein
MIMRAMILGLVLVPVITANALAGHLTEKGHLADGRDPEILTGETVWAGPAKQDTVCLLGSDGPYALYYGNFEDAAGAPNWDRWFGLDMTERSEQLWHIDSYNASTTPCLQPAHGDTAVNHAWWCGEDWPSCGGEDPAGGYGNNYEQYLEWWGLVDPDSFDVQQPVTVRVTARLSYDDEPGYDYLYLMYEDPAVGLTQFFTPGVYNGKEICIAVDEVDTRPLPISRSGHDGKWIHLRWHFESDGAWSDEDCLHPTEGAAQIDSICVFFSQGSTGPLQIGYAETCEDLDGDGQIEDDAQWGVGFPLGVGDYARVWALLTEIDPCCINTSPQVAFFAHPATGLPPYSCITWCYGPGGYIVHPEGGAAGPELHIHNEIWSPVMCWPEGDYDGALFEFTVYRHETLAPSSPGVFYIWHVDSSHEDTGYWPCPTDHPVADPPYDLTDPAQAPFYPPLWQWNGWTDRNFVYYGGPDCIRVRNVVSDLLVPGRKYVRCALGVYEMGWVWGWWGVDGTPAPYFDDVRFCAYRFPGPAISAREIDLAQDNFPAIGAIDYGDPCRNSIRFDMARDIALPTDNPCNVPGDSIHCDVVPVQTGSQLVGLPALVYKLRPNPLFDACRIGGFPAEGSVPGRFTYHNSGPLFPDRYNFDLPDTGFFFPGDVIHFYIRAEDDLGGVTTLPGDTTGFSLFPGDDGYFMMQYPSSFIVRGLPTLLTLTPGDQPPSLWWNDFADRGLENEWYHAWRSQGRQEGYDFDTYYTNGPSSGVGNGLGGRATATQLAAYDVIVYAAGDLSRRTLSNGECQDDPGDDLALLENWLLQGDKCLILSGNDLVYDLNSSGAAGLAFENTWIQASFVGDDVREHVPAAAAVQALPLPPGNPVLYDAVRWAVFSACNPIMRYPDAIAPEGNAIAIAEWLDPSCAAGQYTLAAGLLTPHPNGVNVITFPYDLGWVIEDTDCGGQPPIGGLRTPVRAQILNDVLSFCGFLGMPFPVSAPPSRTFAVKAYPSPFNPRTTIEYALPATGHLSLKVYDLRGRLVATLFEGQAGESGSLVWQGKDDRDGEVASGVYFLVARAAGKEIVRKLAVVR